jgi:hypothetical protein
MLKQHAIITKSKSFFYYYNNIDSIKFKQQYAGLSTLSLNSIHLMSKHFLAFKHVKYYSSENVFVMLYARVCVKSSLNYYDKVDCDEAVTSVSPMRLHVDSRNEMHIPRLGICGKSESVLQGNGGSGTDQQYSSMFYPILTMYSGHEPDYFF